MQTVCLFVCFVFWMLRFCHMRSTVLITSLFLFVVVVVCLFVCLFVGTVMADSWAGLSLE